MGPDSPVLPSRNEQVETSRLADCARGVVDEPQRGSGSTRRSFLKTGLVTASGLIVARTATGLANNPNSVLAPDSLCPCIDYGRSYVCNTAEFNSVRFKIESRTIITDALTGRESVYYLCASCKAEWTFGPHSLFLEDNFDFLPVFGDGSVLVFRRHASKRGETYRAVYPALWGIPIINLPDPRFVVELDSFQKLYDAAFEGLPIIAQTRIENADIGLSALIEYPCKTVNLNFPSSVYQMDTGPVALPDLSKKYSVPLDSLELAFVAFNKPDFADFIVEAPIAIVEGGTEVATVYHYSKTRTFSTSNKIFAIASNASIVR